MTGILFLAAFVGLPLVGAAPILSRRWRGLPFGSALACAAAVGAVILCAEMFVLTIARAPWTPGLLLAAPAVAIAIVVGRGRAVAVHLARSPSDRATPAAIGLLLIAGAAVAFVAYAAMTARVTSSDLHLFWAAKGEHFGLERRIDADFLGRADHRLMHSDYPPLWPCLYAFGTMLAGRFAWGAALATLPIFLALSVAAVASLARLRLGSFEAAGFAAVFASLFGFLLSDFMTAGGADPLLLFFETLALCLVVFAREEPGAFLLAGIALAGATWLKLEGIAFGWAVIAAAAVAIRPLSLRKLAQLAAPPLIAYGTWMAFCRANDLLETLGSHRLFVTGERLRTIVSGMFRAASMGSGYLPWVLVALLFVFRRPGREAAVAIVVAALVAAFDGAFYLAAVGDPTVWISMAGPRTLMTPLMALLLAAMAPRGATASAERREAAASSRP
jgi:uncharacterized membrane protein